MDPYMCNSSDENKGLLFCRSHPKNSQKLLKLSLSLRNKYS